MTITAVLMTISAIVATDGNALDYKVAYEKAQAGNKPLLVLVTAEWCPPCQIMKTTTIPNLLAKDAFKDTYFATVDLDKQSALARKLIGSRGVPQLILFEKSDGKWLRRYLRGVQTEESVQSFLEKSPAIRMAHGQLNSEEGSIKR